jgi:hypothetical protein
MVDTIFVRRVLKAYYQNDTYINKEAARNFSKPVDFQSILKTIGVSEEQFEETRKQIALKDTAGLKVTAQTSGAPDLYEPIITYLTWVVLHDAFKTKKGITYPTHQEYDFFHDTLVGGKVEDLKKVVLTDNVPRNQLQQYMQKYQSSAKSDTKLTKEDLAVLGNKKEVVNVGGGWSWVTLLDENGGVRGGSPVLTKILGHCGNGEGAPGDKMYLLQKNVVGLIPVIKATVIVNGEGNIRESKASFNKKIDVNKYGGAFLKLLEQPFVKGLDDSGAYRVDSNLHMSDFPGTPFAEQAKALIEKKPELSDNAYDKVITDYKEGVSKLPPEERKEKLLELIKTDKINLVQSRALNNGSFPFSEKDLITMIESGYKIEKIGEAETSLFTPEVQRSLAKKNPSHNISVMMFLAATLNKHPIEKEILIEGIESTSDFSLDSYDGAVGGQAYEKLVDYFYKNLDLLASVIKKYPDAIGYFPEDERMGIFNKMPDAFREGFKKDPDAIKYFPEDERMGIFNKMPDAFREGFKKDPESIQRFPIDERMDIFNKMPDMPDAFREGFKKDPDAIEYFPEDDRMGIFNKIPDAFREGFKKDPESIKWFPIDERMGIFNKMPDMPDAFREGFRKSPRSIKYFPEGSRMDIFNKMPVRFREVFKKDPGFIQYFPEGSRMDIFNKRFNKMPDMPDAFREGFKWYPDAIKYFPEDERMGIFNKIPDAFREGFKTNPSAIRHFPEDERMGIFNMMPDAFRRGFKWFPGVIQWFPKEHHDKIIKKIKELESENLTKKCGSNQKPYRVLLAYLTKQY